MRLVDCACYDLPRECRMFSVIECYSEDEVHGVIEWFNAPSRVWDRGEGSGDRYTAIHLHGRHVLAGLTPEMDGRIVLAEDERP